MKVQCSKCESTYSIKDEKIPDAGAKIRCPKCQTFIHVMKIKPASLDSGGLSEDTKSGLPPSTSAPSKNTGESLGILMLSIPVVAAMLIFLGVGSSSMIGNRHDILTLIVLSTVSITAILAAVEASQLGFGKNKSGKRENGPVGLFFGIILMWIIGYPYYLYQRSKKGKKNLLAGGILVSLLFTSSVFGMNFVMNGGMSSEISMVKNGILNKYPNKTVGEAVEGFMGNPYWNTILGNDGNKYVSVAGSISYRQEEVRAAIQFRLNENNDSFEINALEFNGIPQNGFMLAALLDKMYGSASD